MPLKIDKPKYTDPHTKANILLQCHFSRVSLSADLATDQRVVVEMATRLLQAMVDVISSNSYARCFFCSLILSVLCVCL